MVGVVGVEGIEVSVLKLHRIGSSILIVQYRFAFEDLVENYLMAIQMDGSVFSVYLCG